MVSVESTIDTGHGTIAVSLLSRSTLSVCSNISEDMVHDAQMDYYGTRLATCSSDRSVKIFDVREGGHQVLSADIRGHEGPVWQLAWAHPKFGQILASCSYDRKVRKDHPGNG